MTFLVGGSGGAHMSPNMSPDTAQHWLDLATAYGPTFFSMLFLLVISRWSYKNYDRACRANPPADPQEKRTLQRTFVASFICGVLLTGASLVWFFAYKPKTYVFSGKIDELQEYEHINSDVAYFRSHPLVPLTADDPPLRNEEFVVVSSTPFKKGDCVHFFFKKDQANRNGLDLLYDPAFKAQEFKIDLDQKSGKLELMPIAPVQPQRAASFFSTVAYAQEPSSQSQLPALRAPEMKQASKPKAKPSGKAKIAEIPNSQASVVGTEIQVLQDPFCSVGKKIAALDTLRRLDPNTVGQYLNLATQNPDEPFAATLLDLTRHSDKEIAYGASTLAKSTQLDSRVRDQLTSTDPEARAAAAHTLYHYDQRSAQIILGSTTAIGAKKAPINWKNLALVPTAFPEGDRYYMQITWNSQDTGQVNCIAQFLSSELDASRPLNDELKLMRGRSSRLVYSVQKDWVVGASQKVSECGAKPIFVSPRYFEASR